MKPADAKALEEEAFQILWNRLPGDAAERTVLRFIDAVNYENPFMAKADFLRRIRLAASRKPNDERSNRAEAGK
jgi:hypothetical protein